MCPRLFDELLFVLGDLLRIFFVFLKDQLIPGCSGVYCPLQEFKQALSGYSLSSELYQSLCNNTEGMAKP